MPGGPSTGRSKAIRGRSRSLSVHNEETSGVPLQRNFSSSVQIEASFSTQAYGEKSRSYAGAVPSIVQKEVATSTLPSGNSKFVVQFCDPLVCRCIVFAKENLSFNGSGEASITKDHMYRFLAALLQSHDTRLSMRKPIDILHAGNITVSSFKEVRKVQNSLFPFLLHNDRPVFMQLTPGEVLET